MAKKPARTVKIPPAPDFVKKSQKAPAPKKKRGKHDALMAVKPKRERAKDTPRSRARRARIQAITARTRAAQKEINDFIADADTSDLDHLPVMIETGPPRTSGSWRNPRDPVARGGDETDEIERGIDRQRGRRDPLDVARARIKEIAEERRLKRASVASTSPAPSPSF